MPRKVATTPRSSGSRTSRSTSARPAASAARRPRRRAASADPRQPVLEAMKDELRRNLANLKLGRFRQPYFISYLLRARNDVSIAAKAGSLVEDDSIRATFPFVEVRVGNYAHDNTDPSEGTGDWFDPEGWALAPLEDDPAALRRMFWLLTDREYKHAVQQFMEKRGRGATRVQSRKKIDDFTREEPVVANGPHRDSEFTVDRDEWAARLREVSRLLTEPDWVEDSIASLHVNHTRQYFANSEGSEHIQEFGGFSLVLYASTTAPRDGTPIDFGTTMNIARREELPSAEKLEEIAASILKELRELRDAPVLSPYSGPALLGPDVTGVIFHEAVGHRLEGERMRLKDEGYTFKGKVGRRILPTFVDLEDDPTMSEYDGTAITGHYAYDEQGVQARPVTLVSKGVLREYLLSRTPVWGFERSNGHGRSDGRTKAQARMGVFIIRARDPKPREELKRILLDECRRQKKSFGLIVEKIDNGLTTTTTHEFQAFAETPMRVLKVNAKTGEETRVRGVEIVGTPLTTINRLVAMGDDYQVFNGYCGAESGTIPQSEIAPSCVVSEIEVQRTSSENRRPPLLAPPSGKAGGRRSRTAAGKPSAAGKRGTKTTPRKPR